MGESVRIFNASMISDDGTLLQGIEITVQDGVIEYVGPPQGVSDDTTETVARTTSDANTDAGTAGRHSIKQLDAGGRLVYPGLINTHTHSAMTLFRSYADDLPLMEWLQHKIWPVEAHLDPEDVYWGTMLATVEMLRSGTTCCCDMYLHMHSAAEAFEASGMRAVVAQGLFSFLPDPKAALRDALAFCSRWNGVADGRIRTMLAPHAPYTCNAEYLKEILTVGRSEGIGLHTHLSESKAEVEQSYAENGVSPVKFLADLGLIGEHPLLAAHCVHINEEDIRLLANANVAVAHNPQCNMKLGNGIAPVSELLHAGVPVGVATDGVASNNNLNLWEEIRLAALLQKGRHGDTTTVPASQALSLAGENAARSVGLSGIVGRIQPGYRADLIFIDLERPQFQPLHDPQAALVYSAYGSEVSAVIVDGVELVRDGRLTLFDEAEIYAKAGERADRLFRAAGVR